MLLAGPQVIADYESKYRNYASQIASQLKGEEVTREPKLVLLGTTSLYAISSSQYNRLAIPIDDTEQEYIRYIKYGLTKGYGSVHLSKETRSSLEELLQYIRRARLVNNQFGEGVNPKLRRISAGLSAIGVYAVSNFMRHRSRRIVYGIPLARSAYAFLRGETDDPDYLFDVSDPEIIEYEMKRIANLWMKRWLTNRVKTKYLDEISAFNKEEYLLSNELPLEIGIYTQQLRMNI
jgi:hypothetical protein